VGIVAGGSVALCGSLLLAYHLARHAGAPMRVYNLLRWLGLGLPVPSDPRLIGPTLAVLNAPLWFAVSALGLLLIVWFWLMRAAAS
jgi:hypothetical protein